jgi:DNA-directed RNA polymerase specialized sigma24 family protein
MGVARNLANGYRRKWLGIRLAPLDDDIAAPNGDRELEMRDLARRVLDATRQLPEVDRSIIGLTLREGLTSSEIARFLGISGIVVRTRKRRAILRLAAQLGAAAPRSAIRA